MLLVLVSAVAGVAFAVAYAALAAVAIWASYTAILPVLAMVFSYLAGVARSSARDHSGRARPDGRRAGAPSVVMIILDELPTRSLLDEDEHVDRPASRTWPPSPTTRPGTATTPRLASQTAAAVPSLLTRDAPHTDAPLATNHPDNLFTLLAPTHELEVLESATQLCPYESCDPTSATTGEVLTATAPDTGDLLDLTAEIWVDRIHPGPPSPPRLDDVAEESPTRPTPLRRAPARADVIVGRRRPARDLGPSRLDDRVLRRRQGPGPLLPAPAPPPPALALPP